MSTKESNNTVFDEIAESWYRLRHWSRFTAELEELAIRWQKGRLLNIGCAHGPDFLPFKEGFDLYGMDSSVRMLEMGGRHMGKFKYNAALVAGDCTALPFHDHSFDFAIAVAVYHHVKGKESRKQGFSELRRVLRPHGECFITVWNRWQPDFWRKGKEVTVPWKTKEATLMRYHYLYTYCELQRILAGSGFQIIRIYPESSYRGTFKYFSRNICVLARADGSVLR